MNPYLEKVIEAFRNPVFCAGLAVIFGFTMCYVTMVRPLQVRLDKREEALLEWERINRLEREAVGTMKTISTEEMRKWVATLDEQNTRFTSLQSKLHKQELELTGPATSYLVIALLAVVSVAGFAAWMIRDDNADAARTLQNAVALLPSLRESIKARETINLSAPDNPVCLPDPTKAT